MKITYDCGGGEEPRVGDYLRTRTGRTYFIHASRQVRSRIHASRFSLTVEVAPADLVGARLGRVLPLVWYPRGRKKPRAPA